MRTWKESNFGEIILLFWLSVGLCFKFKMNRVKNSPGKYAFKDVNSWRIQLQLV